MCIGVYKPLTTFWRKEKRKKKRVCVPDTVTFSAFNGWNTESSAAKSALRFEPASLWPLTNLLIGLLIENTRAMGAI